MKTELNKLHGSVYRFGAEIKGDFLVLPILLRNTSIKGWRTGYVYQK